MTTVSKKRKTKAKPVLLNFWSDYYSLGIFCQKTNLVEYARKNLSCLRNATQDCKLFNKGIADANDWEFEAVAYEISQIRKLTGTRFDAFINDQAGYKVMLAMQEAVADNHDWETPEQIKVGVEILDLTGQQPQMEKSS